MIFDVETPKQRDDALLKLARRDRVDGAARHLGAAGRRPRGAAAPRRAAHRARRRRPPGAEPGDDRRRRRAAGWRPSTCSRAATRRIGFVGDVARRPARLHLERAPARRIPPRRSPPPVSPVDERLIRRGVHGRDERPRAVGRAAGARRAADRDLRRLRPPGDRRARGGRRRRARRSRTSSRSSASTTSTSPTSSGSRPCASRSPRSAPGAIELLLAGSAAMTARPRRDRPSPDADPASHHLTRKDVPMNQPDRVELGPLQVSRLCLGTMLMGGKTPPAEAHRMLDAFVDAGHNFIDTADVYGDGAAEEVLAPWLARRRDDVVVTTKVRFPVSDPGGAGPRARAHPRRLRRQPAPHGHRRDRPLPGPRARPRRRRSRTTLEALDGLVRAGKVRALGLSNFPAWLLAWAVRTQDCEGWAPFVALQAQYSLVERSAELDLLPCCRATGLGMMPWGPLGGGFFTGRLQRGSTPAPGAASPRRPTTSRRRCTAARPSATSMPSTRRSPSPRSAARRCRRSRSRGCCTSRRSPRPCSAREPPSSSRTSCRPLRCDLSAATARRLGSHTQPPETYPHRMLAEQRGDRPEPALRRARPRVDAPL